jgi:hypothetical protein
MCRPNFGLMHDEHVNPRVDGGTNARTDACARSEVLKKDVCVRTWLRAKPQRNRLNR